MNRSTRVIFSICCILLLWLSDALLLCFSQPLSYGEALWSAVEPWRLLLRLALSALLLLACVMQVLRGELSSRHYQHLSPASQKLLFGEKNSPRCAVRMHYHCLRLAAMMHVRPGEQERLRLLCYCHDIGLIGVEDELIDKPRPLSPEEQARYDLHIDLGAEIAACIPQLCRVAPLIRAHEEYYNGGGAKAMYGRSIPISCRIFKLVQMYDSFTHPQDGSRPMEEMEALNELSLYSGQALDPDVLEAFRRLMTDRHLAETITQHIFAS